MATISDRTVEDNAGFLLGLYRAGISLTEQEVYDYFLEHAIKITNSKIGFFQIVTADQKIMKLTTWNQEALKSCMIPDETHYPLEKAGNWADCIRVKKPVIYNNYKESPNQKGLPSGHVKVFRMVSFPIVNDGDVFAIFCVGNSEKDYLDNDINNLELVAGELNKILLQRRTEEKLRASEEKFRQLALHSPDTVYVIDMTNYRVDFVNCNSFLGYSLEELQRKDSILRSVHLDDKSAVMNNWQSVVKGESEGEKPIEYRLKSRSGNWEWIRSRATTLRRDATGLPTKILINLTVITERKTIEEELRLSEERFCKAFNSNPAAISISRVSDGLIIDVNETCLHLFGFSRQEVIGHTSTELGIFGFNERQKLLNVLKTDERVRNIETTLITKNGQQVQVLMSMDKIKVNDVDYLITTAADITERKELELKLQKYTEGLEELVWERTKQLKESERLAAIGTTAAMVGHDIRNPLQAMISDVYLLKKSLQNMPECATKNQVEESLQGIEDNILYVNKIVADLQDYAKPHTPNLTEFNLYELITDIFRSFSVPDNIQLSIDVDAFLTLRSDPMLLRRAFFNLITNAVQAMASGGSLRMSAKNGERCVYVTVEDSGVGIPEEVKSKLFVPMFTTKSKGQGFGLAVVKRLVEALSGKIGFESEEGKGSKFIVELPIT